MAIKIFPDFEHQFKPGDRLITEITCQSINAKLAWVTINIVFSPAGAKGGRAVIFVDDGEAKFVEGQE
jgi:hypothetical protein